MRFQDKLREVSQSELWEEYCGFLELTVEEFMKIQKRLLREQMELWGKSGIGRRILGGRIPENIDEFRRKMCIRDRSYTGRVWQQLFSLGFRQTI